jgi:hypothetical protein
MKHIKKHSTLIVGLILGAFFLLSLSLAWQESATFDEKAHVPAAYTYVRYGDMRLNPEHPPLLKDLAGLPLLFQDLSFPIDSAEWQNGVNEQWTLGMRFIFQSDNDADQIMFWSRVPIILVALLLGFFVYRWTKELAGTVAGLFALLLYAADPNIIAHGHYVTTDLGIAATVFMSFYYFVRFLRKPTAKHMVLFGIFLGIAQLTKFSAVLLFPYFGLIILLYALSRPKADTIRDSRVVFFARQLLGYILRYAGAILVCFVLIWGLYFVNTINEPGTKIAENAGVIFGGDNAASVFARDTVTALTGSAITKPFAQYFLGVFMVFARVAGGNTYYFLGEVSNVASPWYFPVVFLLKETLPFLFLLAFGSLYTLYRVGRSFTDKTVRTPWNVFAHSFQSHIAQYTMFGFVALYAFVSITGNLNIGFRHLFPIMPFLHVLIAKTVFDFARRSGFQGEHATRAAIAGLAFWIFSIPVLSYPSYLSYFNEAAGGPKEGYHYVTDSNYDWGQDLKRLSTFVDEFNACKAGTAISDTCDRYEDILRYPAIDELRMAYFGGAAPEYYLGDTFIEWYADWGRRPGWHAMSVNAWQESLYQDNPENKETYQWVIDGKYPMAYRAGDSIFVYYIPPFGR